MRKYSFLLIVVLMVGMAINAYAEDQRTISPEYKGTVYTNPVDWKTPPSWVLKVRYAAANNTAGTLLAESIKSGEAVIWDVNSADGITVTRVLGGTAADMRFAGIAVTEIPTQDAGATALVSTNDYGYICVRGYCLASIDAAITAAAATSALVVSEGTGGLSGAPTTPVGGVSSDVATLLGNFGSATTAGQKYPVWVK